MVIVSFDEIERSVAGDVNASMADTVFMGGRDNSPAMTRFC
jgi:hypothetical protein